MGQAASNVVKLSDMRKKKLVKGDLLALNATQETSPSAILSFNIANLVFANINEISGQKIKEKDPDLQSALLFARARLYYLEGRYHDAGKIFQAVINLANSDDLRALAVLSWSNCLFTQGEYLKAKNCLDMNKFESEELPDALRLGFWLQKGNIAFATGTDADAASAYYRRVFNDQTRSLWVQCLQQTLVGFNPVSFSEFRSENLKGLRNLLDAFIEVGASRYYASLVLTFS